MGSGLNRMRFYFNIPERRSLWYCGSCGFSGLLLSTFDTQPQCAHFSVFCSALSTPNPNAMPTRSHTPHPMQCWKSQNKTDPLCPPDSGLLVLVASRHSNRGLRIWCAICGTSYCFASLHHNHNACSTFLSDGNQWNLAFRASKIMNEYYTNPERKNPIKIL